jgi:hypothetical protein
MADSCIDRLLNSLRMQLAGATDSAIQLELWNTVDDFCRMGWAWRETLEIELTEGVVQYTIPAINAEGVAVLNVAHPTFDIGSPIFEYGKLTLTTAPTAADIGDTPVMFVTMALAPQNRDVTDMEALIPFDMWIEHYQAFLKGTLARMMAQASKPYSNANLARFHLRDYNGYRAEAKRKAETGGDRLAQRWRFPRFA